MDNNLIINNIKTILKCDTDSKLADYLGIKPTVLSNWRVRGTINYELIITKCGIDVLSKAIKEDFTYCNNLTEFVQEPQLKYGNFPSQIELLAINRLQQEEISQLKSRIIELQDELLAKKSLRNVKDA